MGLVSRFIQLLKPMVFIAVGVVTAGISVAELALTLNFSTLLSPSAFRKHWFVRTWGVVGTPAYRMVKDTVAPLVEQAQGRVLDIGTGTGNFLVHYDRSKVTKLYVVETNRGQHPGLRAKAKEANLEDRIEIFDKPLEQLRDQSDLRYGTMDTIVTIQVLCSVDDPDGLTKELYKYLKPGGRWIVYEHVKAEGYTSWIQKLLNIVWPRMFDGCSLCRDTKSTIVNAGKWQTTQLERSPEDPPGAVIPHTMGYCFKT